MDGRVVRDPEYPTTTGAHRIAVDGRDLKTTDNYWRYLTRPSTNKLRFLLNDKPSREGAWEIAVTPATNFGDLQYARWVERIAPVAGRALR